MKLIEITDKVQMVKNAGGQDYNTVFMDFGKYLVALEAPLGNWASKLAITDIRKIYPEKLIQYTMITHFHGDHSGGVGEYVKEGATIIAPKSSKAYFEELFNATHNLSGQGKSENLEPEFLTIEKESFTLSCEYFDLIIKDIGPNAHVNHILIGYSPQIKFLFQGDLFRVPEDNSDPEPPRKEALEFYDSIKSAGWEIDFLTGA